MCVVLCVYMCVCVWCVLCCECECLYMCVCVWCVYVMCVCVHTYIYIMKLMKTIKNTIKITIKTIK